MNEIKIKRMLLAGLAMFVMWIAIAVLLEGVIADIVLGQSTDEMWLQVVDPSGWGAPHYWLEIFTSLLNCTVMIWLYASLRPMYGVGTKTALITSAFGVTLLFSLSINLINLGLLPLQLGLTEVVFEAIEFPIAMIVGAGIYEGAEKRAQRIE